MARHRGRCETALERDLLDLRPDGAIGPAERAALRVQARAVDTAEAQADPHLVTEANRGYLELRTAAGLSAAVAAKPADSFDAFLAGLGGPGAGASDPSQP